MRRKVCKEPNKRERERENGKKGTGFLSPAFLSIVVFFFFFPFKIGSVKILTKKDLYICYRKARRGESWIY